MADSDQQKQTKEFFEKYASVWNENAKSDSKTNVNVVGLRNQFVEDACSQYLEKNAKTLDVGCGTGDLVISLLRRRFDADRKSTRLNSSHSQQSRMPSSA